MMRDYLEDPHTGRVITIDHAAVERRGWEAFVRYMFQRLEEEGAISEHSHFRYPSLAMHFYDLNVPPHYPKRALDELVKCGQATWDPCERVWRRIELELDWGRDILGV